MLMSPPSRTGVGFLSPCVALPTIFARGLKGCIYSDHAADLRFAPSARNGQATRAHDLTGSTSGQLRGSLSKP